MNLKKQQMTTAIRTVKQSNPPTTVPTTTPINLTSSSASAALASCELRPVNNQLTYRNIQLKHYNTSRVPVPDEYHDSTVVTAVLQPTIHSYRTMENSTLRNFVPPQPIITKLGMIDNVRNPYRQAKFS